MDLSKLKPAEGSVRKRKRVGRGEGSGNGDTATRGHKGAKSRSGYSRKAGFEGGQMPLQRRVPKFGFRNRNRVAYRGVNLDTLQHLVDQHKLSEINLEALIERGVADKRDRVKILGRGELNSKVTVKAHAFSASAKSAIEKQGGEAIIL